jgi:hypothetical protein
MGSVPAHCRDLLLASCLVSLCLSDWPDLRFRRCLFTDESQLQCRKLSP